MKKAMLFLAVFALVGSLWAADPFVGTWKLNVAKSKASDPSLMSKSGTLQNIVQGSEIRTIMNGVDSQGKTTHSEWSGTWDGKDFPFNGDSSIDTSSIKRIDPNTVEVVAKKAGKEVSTYKSSVSKDGKTMTIVAKGRDAKGLEWSSTQVFDKQ
jgi:hypothetical protein